MKRQRGRGRRPGGGGGGHQHNNHNQPNRTMESSGPEVKVRGPAAVIYERYLQLARDAASSGDRVLSENYMQHADHYFRLVRAMQPAMPPPQPERYSSEFDGEEDGAPEREAEEGEVVRTSAPSSSDQPEAEFPQDQEQRAFDRDGDPRRRRGRRNRFRPGGAEGEEGEAPTGDPRGGRVEGEARRDDGEVRRDRSEGRDGVRRERPPREPREERRPRDQEEDHESGAEGFSTGPKPAFLRD